MQAEVTSIFERNAASTAKTIVNVGGARSSKSYSIAQLLIMRLVNCPGRKILVTRKTFPSLRISTLKLCLDLLDKYGLLSAGVYSATEHCFRLNGSYMLFSSLDDPDKIKSTDFNDIWMEEANEFSWEDYIVLSTRMSSPPLGGIPNQLFISFNPSESNGWIRTDLLKQQGVEVIKSTYHDNPFLSEDYIAQLEGLKDKDMNAWRVYACGEWGNLEGRIYTRYDICEAVPENLDEVLYGVDFGFNNPSAVVRVGVKDRELYVEQLVYHSGLTNDALIEKLIAAVPEQSRHAPIYADAAEPARIQAIENAGFNVFPADKAVLPGIDSVKARHLHITRASAKLIDELQVYKWRTDRNGHTLDEPVKENDHACDALRYAVHTHFAARVMPEITIL